MFEAPPGHKRQRLAQFRFDLPGQGDQNLQSLKLQVAAGRQVEIDPEPLELDARQRSQLAAGRRDRLRRQPFPAGVQIDH